jgi:ribosomal protein S18 acetylase RimI-like enzyme
MPELLPYKHADYPAMLELTRESIVTTGRRGAAEEFDEELFKGMIGDEQASTLVMWDCEALAGFVTFSPDEEHLFINWLVLRPDYRNRGFASMLLDEVGRAAAQRGLRLLRICLQESNHPAITVCEAAGFQRVALEPMGWVMEKPVVPERGD